MRSPRAGRGPVLEHVQLVAHAGQAARRELPEALRGLPTPVTLFFLAKPSPLGFRPPKSGRSIAKFTGYMWICGIFWCTDSDGPVECQKSGGE